MITYENGVFRLSTDTTGYWFRVTGFGHLEHIYYGARLPEDQSADPLILKRTVVTGSGVLYDESDAEYVLDNIPLEWSGIGKGDYRNAPAEILMPDGTYTADFRYQGHEIRRGAPQMKTLPSSYGGPDECETLTVAMRDESNGVLLELFYTVYPASDVVARRAVLTNHGGGPLVIRKLMSMSVDLPNREFSMVTLDGGWIREGHRHDRTLSYGIHVNSSTTGASSNRHNPAFMLAESGCREETGRAYGFNLVYSGNHYGAAELSIFDLVRVQTGINPYCFSWKLEQGESFETPEAVMTFSDTGFNGVSAHFHDFVNRHIVRGEWKGKERPVLLNSWEACFFEFTRGKLLRLARGAKRLGAEMFVLDDGWFGARNSDTAGLGDYGVNRKKLPRGLRAFSDQVRRIGLRFGMWFEPEMVNEDSDLFRAHPEFAVSAPGKVPAKGRHQLVLDLCNPAVRDYIVEQVSRVLDEGNPDYVKWDMNRHISDACSPCIEDQGEFFHRYILGLYEILDRIFSPRRHILLESCSSGGNRFDLGMLCFSPQVWASDDTDAAERLKIQGGLSYFYPLSAMGAHVAQAPHYATLRDTPLPTRFNVSSFGCLGYELDLRELTPVQKKEVKRQIEFYKAHRELFQYGRFLRSDEPKENRIVWHCVKRDGGEALTGFFQTVARTADGFDRLRLQGIARTARYEMEARPQSIFIKRFGGLLRHILPVNLMPDGWVLRTVNRYFCLTDGAERYTGYGQAFLDGVLLCSQFMGTGYHKDARLLGDFGSGVYYTKKIG